MSVPFLTHDTLDFEGITHGFFGRHGGVSQNQYSSLNAGAGSNDSLENIAQNRALIAGALGTSSHCLLSLSQIHSTDVLIIDAPFGEPVSGQLPQADGLVTNTPGLAISALSADCGPVLLCDPKARVIGACHAGWRGAIAGITDETISAMERLGASRANITAVLGPCISQTNYEVGQAFKDDFLAKDKSYARFFAYPENTNQNEMRKPHFDLKLFITEKLRAAGIGHVNALADCTYGQADTYFSFRYNTHNAVPDYGRNLSAIMIT